MSTKPAAGILKDKSGFAWLLAGVFAVALLLGLGFVFLVPFGEKPDEPSHLSRAIHLAWYGVESSTAHYPVFPDIVTYEAVQPPVYYHVAASVLRFLPEVTWNVKPSRLYGCVERSRRFVVSPGWGDLPQQVMIIRTLGLVAVLCSGVFLFVAARQVLQDEYGALLAVSFQALLPQMLFISSAASNDGFAVVSGTVVLALALWAAHSGTAALAFLAGCAAVAALWIKLNTAGYVVGIPLLFIAWQRRRLPMLLGSYLCGVFVPFLVGALLMERGGLVDVDFIMHRLHLRVGSVGGKEYLSSLPRLLTSYWAQFGWMELHAYDVVRLFWAVILVCTTAGWAVGRRRWRLPLWPLWAMLATVLAGWAFTLGSTNQIQGRFLFPYSGLIAIVLAAGLFRLTPSRRALVSFVICLVLANGLCLWQLWKRYQPIDDQGNLVLDCHQCYSDRVVLETLSAGWESCGDRRDVYRKRSRRGSGRDGCCGWYLGIRILHDDSSGGRHRARRIYTVRL
jgi:hypothetical protein